MPRKHRPGGPGRRPLQLRGAAFDGWTLFGAEERRREPPDQRVSSPLSAPGSTDPGPKIAARGAPRGDTPRSGSRTPAAPACPLQRLAKSEQASLRRDTDLRLSALRPLALFRGGDSPRPLGEACPRGGGEKRNNDAPASLTRADELCLSPPLILRSPRRGRLEGWAAASGPAWFETRLRRSSP